jgi:hypothetical protein
MMNAARLLPLALAIAVLAACGPKEDPEAAKRVAAAAAAQQEQAAAAREKEFEEAYARKDWKLARGYGDMLQMEYPRSPAATRIQERLDEARAHLRAEDDKRRMAALWAYQEQAVKGGKQISAALYSKDPVDVDGKGKRPVRLIFRDHPDWGRSSYLVLETGDFDCYGGCKVKVQADDAAAKSMPGTRPKTDEAIAMFIEDERALWRLAKQARRLSITFPVKAGGTRTAVFETSGVDPSKLPRWN